MNYMCMPGMKQTRSKVRPMVAMKMEAEKVIQSVCGHFNVTFEDLKKVTRKRQIVYKRQMVMYFLSHYTNMTYVEIGRLFEKDHTTVIHSKDLIRNLLDIDDTIKDDVEEIKRKLVEAYF